MQRLALTYYPGRVPPRPGGEQKENFFAGRRSASRSTDVPAAGPLAPRKWGQGVSAMVEEAEFRTWETHQQLRFALVDGRPVRLPDADQGPSRVAGVRQIAARALADQTAADAWIGSPQADLGGLEPEALAADSEEGCQIVLRALVALGRHREGVGD